MIPLHPHDTPQQDGILLASTQYNIGSCKLLSLIENGNILRKFRNILRNSATTEGV